MRPTIHVIAQSHIDVAWLWRYDPETIYGCCEPTFNLAIENMERYSDYHFSQSQVPLYEAVEGTFPGLFEKMKEHIKEGRWEIVGGSYVEFEGGEPCGESIVRQCIMGKRYFHEKFGVDVKTGWQVDAWSHPWQLPQILSKCGITSYLFRRGEKGEKLFWWQSPDGSRVLAYKPLFEYVPSSWEDFLSKMSSRYGVDNVAVMIGRGDHGGGPTPEEIEAIRLFAERVSPRIGVRFNTFGGFSEAVLAQKKDFPVINDELGFELVGDLTNCGEIKRENRYCENLLLATERFCSVASIMLKREYPEEELHESWRRLLFNQFHDIIGGSGIPAVCEDAMRFYEIIKDSCRKQLRDSLSSISANIDTEGHGQALVVFNPLAWERTDLAEVELELRGGQRVQLLDENGNELPIQVTEDVVEGERRLMKFIFIAENVPSLGYRTYRLITEEGRTSCPSTLSAGELSIENEFFRVEVDPYTGCLRRIFDKLDDFDVLDGSKRGNSLVAIEDLGDSEGRFVKGSDAVLKPPGRAWDILGSPVVEVCEVGPVRAKLGVKKRFHNSAFTQEIMLYSKMRRVDFNLVIDWHDVHWMIKVAFPLNLKNPEVTYDSAYGSIVRPADGLEYPAQKWVDLSSSGKGVALLNNCRYGHDVQDSTIRISLLRSPTEPARNTDEGTHTIGYSVYPHSGTWKDADVIRRGYEFNCPLITSVESLHQGILPAVFSFMKVEPRSVILEVLKRAYDADGFIIRAYETHGEECDAKLVTPWTVKCADETDLMERVTRAIRVRGNAIEFGMRPHEIKTLLFVQE